MPKEKDQADLNEKESEKKESDDFLEYDLEKELDYVDSDKGKKEIEKNQKKILRNLLIGFGVILIIIFGIYFLGNYDYEELEYQGIEFNEYPVGDLLFYYTYFEIYDAQGKHTANYNLYLRKDPRKTGKIEFDGDLELKSHIVLNFSEDINFDLKCEGDKKGDDVIAMANFVSLLSGAGTSVVKDENASCDSENRYIFMNILEGDKTRIEEFEENCYNIYVKNCEIISGLERFILEVLVELKKRHPN